VAILCYHSVEVDAGSPLAVTPQLFAAHCEWLARSRRVVDLPEAIAALGPRGSVPGGLAAITFDDGFTGVHEHALPVLRRLRLPSTVFVVAETLLPGGKAVDWVEDRGAPSFRTMTLEQVREAQDQGVRIGSHSYSHHDLTTLSEAECERDLRQSREVLEDLLGVPVPYLAYPRGRHNAVVRRAAAAAGFTHAFTLPERAEPVGDHAIPRVGVYDGNSVTTVRIKERPAYLRVRTSTAWPLVQRLGGSLRRRASS
jgi:peptidoglycan/xylan/chitin deacetylase (PgdA/CDA1 family)